MKTISRHLFSSFFYLLCFSTFAACAHSHSGSDHEASVSGLDPELKTFSYPFPVHFFEFDSQKQHLKMAYMDVTPIAFNDRTVVLLHGKNFTSAYWEETARFLAEHGFRVVMIDQIGFGKSSKPEAYSYSFAALAQNTASLLASLGLKKYSVVGHSMGGMLAVRFAILFPGKTEKLVLVNPIGLEDSTTVVPYHTIDEIYRDELEATPESIRAYEKANYFSGRWKPEYDRLTEVPIGWVQHPDYNIIAWNSALTLNMILTEPIVYELARITPSTLLIIGQQDRTVIGKKWATETASATLGNYPLLGRRAQRSIANSKLAEIASAGHLPQIDAPHEFQTALLSFLNERQASPNAPASASAAGPASRATSLPQTTHRTQTE
jgi:pimeloyl-ACP methyl ester carboxylesterase